MDSKHSIPVAEIDHFAYGKPIDLPVDPDERARVTLVLRPRTPHHTMREHIGRMASQLPNSRKYFTRKEFAHHYGATEEDLAVVAAFAGENMLEVEEISHARRRLVLHGRLADLEQAFSVTFIHLHSEDHGVYRSHRGAVKIPADLEHVVQAVLGFSTRSHYAHPATASVLHARGKLTDPRRVAKAYEFPSHCAGKGQTVGIISLGGGFHESDLDAYFQHLGLPKPKITVVEVGDQKNNPADSEAIREFCVQNGIAGLHRTRGKCHPSPHLRRNSAKNIEATLEITMDVELVGTWANQAHIVVYFTHNNPRGKYEAFNTALHDEVHKPSVISCSWGAPEKMISRVLVEEMDRQFQAAALMGITICCSSGDQGDGADDAGEPQANFPACSPHVLACGGTMPRPHAEHATETVWRERIAGHTAESGYGESSIFHAASWQSGVGSASQKGGRVVPDVAGKADVETGYDLIVGGIHVPGCGTSAAAPLWASLAALLNEELKTSVGHITPLLYDQRCRSGVRSVGASGAAWVPKVGLGTPRGTALLEALRAKSGQAE